MHWLAQVGALAAKRAKEKAAERKKRRSLEFPPGAVTSNANSSMNYSNSNISPRDDKFTSSPEMIPASRSRVVLKEGQGQMNQRPASSVQLSTALSSINKNSDEYFDKIGGVGQC